METISFENVLEDISGEWNGGYFVEALFLRNRTKNIFCWNKDDYILVNKKETI